ncbi:hypothetical protein [Desertivirga arenae]|uniref:hypothetical protein n=1 Tax=Desertivirga arenae TaxID=2810309 RepID=UPI001A95BDEF|nr:hypothetical protein [Pedobacter sp. SYSU D00823]
MGTKKNNKSDSKIDKITGKHTINIILAMLFIITLLSFVAMYSINGDLPSNISSIFSTLLAGLVGSFRGNNFRN